MDTTAGRDIDPFVVVAKLNDDDVLLTPAQVAERLSVSLAWVRDHSTRRKPYLPVVKIGGLRRYPKSEFERFINEQKSLTNSVRVKC
jgi:hypothetical protein